MSNDFRSNFSKKKSKSQRRRMKHVTFREQNCNLSVKNNKSFEVTERKRAHEEQGNVDSKRNKLFHNDQLFVPMSKNAPATIVREERPLTFVFKSGESISKHSATETFSRRLDNYSCLNKHDYQNNDENPKKPRLSSDEISSKTGESISRNLDNQKFGHIVATPTPMSYTCLKNLCDDQITPEETSSRLSEHAQLQRFEALLQQQNDIRYDLMKMVVSVIDKVCQSRVLTHLHIILGIVNKTRFWYTLGIFIAELDTKNECLKDPHVTILLKHLCKIFRVSLERLPHLHSHIPFHQLQSAVNFFKGNGYGPTDPAVDNLLTDMITKCERVKKGIREKGQSQVEPPDDFRTLSVFPTAEDILRRGKPFLRENIVKRPFSSVDHYLDIHFRLLKEDSLASLRNGIWDLRKSYRQQQYGQTALDSLSKSSSPRAKNDVIVYNEVTITGQMLTNHRNVTKGIVYNVTFNANHPSIKRINWARSKRLLFGSLVCLISNDFEKVHFATVENRSADMLEQGYIQLCFERNKCPGYDDMQEEYRMVESSSAYFVAYRHILERLQQMKDETMPFKDYIVFCEQEIAKPSYFKADKQETINLESVAVQQLQSVDEDQNSCEVLKNVSPYDLSTWPDWDVIGLNESQYRAFQSALRREFVVIQGPPGTGKTYLGLKIAHTLLDNNHLWKDVDDVRSCPILMLAYTNHALDSFLEGLNLNRKDIIRVGGRSSSDVLKECNINVVRRERRSTDYQGRVRLTNGRRFHQVRRDREECQASLNRYTDILAKSFKGILPAREFMGCMMVAEHMECLSDNHIMLDFLGISLNPEMGQNATEFADEEEGFEEFFGQELGGHFYVGDSSQLEEDEKQEAKDKIVICLVEETSRPDGLLELLKGNGTDPEGAEVLEIRTRGSELFQLNVHEKWSLYLLWLTRLREKLHINIREEQSRYLDLNNEYEELRNIEDLGILRNSRVIGMTTTCASKNHKLLRQLKPRVVIVEEAAELFEAHIVSCLTESCQHLILIGDHQQLRPNPSVYNLSVNYSLDVSLLERMIEAGVPFNRLSVQHRMRPEISKLFRHIYNGLDDHASVAEYEDIRGVSKNLFFVDHDVRESVHDNVHSKVNQHEAEFLVELCLYLLRQGYKSSQITILTTYTGQMFAIRDLIKNKKEEFEDNLPRVSNVDNFQGEENDVILLSLVRNNEEENIGFLKANNRVCVALSRAKKGLYISGNRTMLTKQSPLWKEVLADLEKNGSVGKSLPLECSKHKTQNLVSSAADFKELVPNGGCLEMCQERLQCGHACPQMCHPNSHENFKCEKPCPRNASGCNVSGHKCIKLCHEKCDYSCQYPVPKVLNCGHTLTLACSVDAKTAKCKERCEKIIPCGHRCQASCSAPCTKQCMELVKKLDLSCGHQNTMACFATQKDCTVPCDTLLECGHPCVGKCGECIQGRVHVKCAKKCNRNLICSHQCKSNCIKNCPPCKEKCPRKCYHNKCKHTCADICIPCKEPCSWTCEHFQCTQLCSDMCDRPRCDRPCNRKLTCGKGEPHFCRSLCEERCVCVICDKNNGEDLRTIFFGCEDNEDARFIRLKDCEHIFEYTALDKLMDSNDESGEIKPKVCPLCRSPIIKSLRYGNVVKRIHNDIDQVKKKVLGNATELEEKKTLARRLASELSPEIIMALESMKSTCIEKAWKKVAEYISRCKSSPVYSQDILLMESEMGLVKIWLLIKRSYEEAIKCHKQSRSSTIHIEFDSEMQHVLSRILVIPAYTSARILNQLNHELQRMSLKRDVLVLKIKCASSKSNFDEVDEQIVTRIQTILRNKEIIEEDSLEKFKKEISDIYSRNPQLAPITEEEKIQIVRAIGLKQGHWFKCPNGHFYAIGECGGAMEKSKCPDCGAVIGGQRHLLVSDNELATEMDGAKYPAWSDQANIQNYQIDN